MTMISTVEVNPPNVLEKVRFSVDDYYKMMELGLLPEDVSTEIIEGELIRIMPTGSLHSGIVDILSNFFVYKLYGQAVIRVQSPVRLDEDNEPLPDISVLKPRKDFYRDSHPRSDDTLLIVEVSDSTLNQDRNTKIPLYAKSGIPEIWIVNVQNKTIEVYINPEKNNYRNITVYQAGEVAESNIIPDLAIEISEVFG